MLRQIMDNSNDVIYRLSCEGEFTYLSSGWQTMFGYSIEEALGVSFEKYIHPDDIDLALKFLKSIIQTRKSQQLRGYRFKCSNGDWIYLDTNASPILENDVIVGYVGVARNITELIKKQERLNT